MSYANRFAVPFAFASCLGLAARAVEHDVSYINVSLSFRIASKRDAPDLASVPYISQPAICIAS